MSIRYIGEAVKKARIQSGFTQEKFSEGICDVTTLARIESGKLGAGPAVFQAFMTKAGRKSEVYPCFRSRRDYECFFLLKDTSFFLDSLQVKKAYENLIEVKNKAWCEDVLYYQEWLLLYARTMKYSGNTNHNRMLDLLYEAINITRKNFINNIDEKNVLYTMNEIEIAIGIAEQLCFVGKIDESTNILSLVEHYLSKSEFASDEKEKLYISINVILAMQNLFSGDYEKTIEIIGKAKKDAILISHDIFLIELHFLEAISLFRLNRMPEYETAINCAICASSVQKSGLINTFYDLLNTLNITLPFFISENRLNETSCINFPITIALPAWKNGTFTESGKEMYDIGKLISDRRREQHLTLFEVCSGVCSTSYLSKIENGYLNPDIMITETLLQRLGVPTDNLIFFGNQHETELYNIRKQITYANRNNKKMEEELVNQLATLISEKDLVMRQYYLFKKALRENEYEKQLNALTVAIRLTITDFSIDTMEKYHMSWNELTIVNNICYTWGIIQSSEETCNYLKRFIKYLDKCDFLSNSLKQKVYSLAISKYSYLAIRDGLYEALIEYHQALPADAFDTKLIIASYYFANLCQAYAMKDMKTEAKSAALKAYNLFMLYNNIESAEKLQIVMKQGFGIDL